MNKVFKIISASILGLLLTTGVFAKPVEVVYIHLSQSLKEF